MRMVTAMVMKEWLKVRWIFIGLAVLHGAALLITYYDLLNTFKIYKANEVVIQFITFEVVFYSKVKYVSLLTGLGIGIFQFFPELNQSRLKLTLHLPVKENRLIFQMAATGAVLIIVLSVFDTLILSLITLRFLPREFFDAMVTTTLPWYLGSLCSYFWVMIVFVEPNWVKRILMSTVGLGIVSLFFEGGGYAMYALSMGHIVLLTLFSSVIIFLSAFNFKRGIW
jgi:hypothetical protein